MSDLISREDALKAIEEYLEEYGDVDVNGYHGAKWCAMAEAQTVIEELPSAERVGHWIDYADTTYANCSECGRQIDTHYERGYLNYCPNCGARMEGEEE